MKVTEPGGTTVRIGRRWLPWRRRLRYLDSWDVPDLPLGDDPVSAALAVIALILAIPFIVLFALAVGELLVLVSLLPLVLLVRIALRRPWTVDVTRGRDLLASHRADDWPAAQELIGDLADPARRGTFLPSG